MVNVNYISSVEDLQNMGKTGYYKLTKNINCDGFNFRSIREFNGTLDGAGHTIKNLNIRKYGLIYDAHNVVIKNIQFDNLNVESDSYCGDLIRDLYGKCKFENVIIKNSIMTGRHSVGGFVGYARSSSTITCSNCKLVNSIVTARRSFVGGFVGYIDLSSSFSASGCVVDGALVEATGSDIVGGFVGYIVSSSSSYSNCSVSNSKVRSAKSVDVGGFVGLVSLSSITFSECDVNNSTVTARSWNVGGFVGGVVSSSIIVNSSVVENTKIVGSNFVGGFVGCVSPSSKVVSVRGSVISGCKVNAKEDGVGSIIGWDYKKTSVISNVPVLNTTVMENKKQVANKVGNIDISSTVRGHVSKVPSLKPTTRKPTARKTTVRKPTVRKTVGKVRVNYKKML